ncbi:uncharacterized protein LOC111394890 [Olea europaea var. sylvestris]|uniref:uncharacterized protein LOC111394890 n=1 Tax=Olea europaea var. sylvestris TaxID=158386 RepID=UPI000C1D0E88|nr:uncharacterized protein LOC111394890 [Olea europaea var. sylvestris]
MFPQSHIASDRDELREPKRVDESVHQTPEQQGQGNVIGTDPIAIKRIAIGVASAMCNTDRDFSIERAIKLGAKVFTGTADPTIAQAWMTKIERLFDVMGCSDDRKLCLSTFLLEEGAYDWWQLVRSTYLDPSIITWIDFHHIFYDAYYSRSYKDAKQEEFLKLVQGQITIAEYQVKFIELSKYAQVLVSNEIDKCRRFEKSALRVEKSISDRPSGREQIIFRASSSQTMASASSYRPPQKDSNGFRTGVSSSDKFKSQFRGSQGPRFNPSIVQQPLSSRTYTQGSFQRSFTPRQGESFTRTGQLYSRRVAWHRGCFLSRVLVEQDRIRLREMIQLTEQVIEESSDLIMGMLSIFDRNARILIGPGSTHSFMSFAFALYANQKSELLGSCLVVNTPVGESLLVNNIYQNCGIKIKENELKANLIPLDIHDFDVILGMDFLTTNRASVDCFRKKVVFRQPGQPEIIFNGQHRILPSCVISAIDARRLLNKGCHAYLAHVIDTDVSKLKLEDIPMVKEFF